MSQLLRRLCQSFRHDSLVPSQLPSAGYKTYKYQGPGKVKNKTSPNAVERYMWMEKFLVNKARCYFPRPNEVKRVRTHGWDARMATEGGRKVLMNRILKGRHVLSH